MINGKGDSTGDGGYVPYETTLSVVSGQDGSWTTTAPSSSTWGPGDRPSPAGRQQFKEWESREVASGKKVQLKKK